MAYALSMKTWQDPPAGRAGPSAIFIKNIFNPPPPPPYILWCLCLHTTIYCGMRHKIVFFGSIPLYIVVQGINSSPFDSIQPQYIVVGNVDKTFLDYIIIAKTKGRAARCAVVLGLFVLILIICRKTSIKH
jgi:hypothetical protein